MRPIDYMADTMRQNPEAVNAVEVIVAVFLPNGVPQVDAGPVLLSRAEFNMLAAVTLIGLEYINPTPEQNHGEENKQAENAAGREADPGGGPAAKPDDA